MCSCLLLLILVPFDVEHHELVKPVGLHVLVVDDIKAEVEQFAVGGGFSLEYGPDVKTKFVEHWFVDDTVAVDEVFQQRIFLDGLQVALVDSDAAGARCVGLNLVSVHIHCVLCYVVSMVTVI